MDGPKSSKVSDAGGELCGSWGRTRATRGQKNKILTTSSHGISFHALYARSLDVVSGASNGLTKIACAVVKSPMDLSLSLARCFHNAPKLYGDRTVRPVDKVSGIRNGLRVTGKELRLCMYDGITGLITQPFQSVKAEGTSGVLKGVGRDIGGLLLKPNAGLWRVPAHTSKGVYMQMRAYLNLDFSHTSSGCALRRGTTTRMLRPLRSVPRLSNSGMLFDR